METNPKPNSKTIVGRFQIERFSQYMLATFQDASTFMIDLSKRKAQFIQFYIAAITASLAGTAALSSQLSQLGIVNLIGLLLLFIGIVGTLTSVQISLIHELEMRQMAIWAGIRAYFREFDTAAFQKYGQEAVLKNFELPHYFLEFSRRPWTKITLMGSLAVAQGIVIAIACGVLLFSLFQRIRVLVALGQLPSWLASQLGADDVLLMIISVFFAELILHTHLYLMASFERRIRIRARRYSESVLKHLDD